VKSGAGDGLCRQLYRRDRKASRSTRTGPTNSAWSSGSTTCPPPKTREPPVEAVDETKEGIAEVLAGKRQEDEKGKEGGKAEHGGAPATVVASAPS
jgi:hypothetical protein